MTFSETSVPPRSTPIAPPSHPRQYRAIGIIRGIFQRKEGEKYRGKLITTDGTEIEAAFLGKMFSLLKNHLDLSQSHLWVVYPRTLAGHRELYVQITGIWEPETLNPTQAAANALKDCQEGFFSIRGEVIYASSEKKIILVKIRQSPQKPGGKSKFFKLKLRGVLSNKPVGRFWDFVVRREHHQLVVQAAEDLGWASQRKPFAKSQKRQPPFPRPASGEPLPKPRSPNRSSPLAKPTKKGQSKP